jgi:uncharacterized integral membrane protein
MRKIIFWLFWLPIGAFAVVVAVNNRTPISLVLDPTQKQLLPTIDLPLYMLLFGFFIAGMLLGGFLVWLKQSVWRKKARDFERENKQMTRDIQRVKLERTALTAIEPPVS